VALKKPTADDERLETAANDAFYPANLTVCMWVRCDTITTNGRFYHGVEVSVGGCLWRIDGSDRWNLLYAKSGGTGYVNVARSDGPSAGVWYFTLASVTSSGSYVMRVDGSRTTGSGAALVSGVATASPTIGAKADGGNPATCTIADFRFYSRALSQAEEDAIQHGHGQDGIAEGLVSRLQLLDREPGATADSTAPVDSTRAQTWATTGIGDALSYEPGPFPIRRRAR